MVQLRLHRHVEGQRGRVADALLAAQWRALIVHDARGSSRWPGQLHDAALDTEQALLQSFWQQPVFIAIEADQPSVTSSFWSPAQRYRAGLLHHRAVWGGADARDLSRGVRQPRTGCIHWWVKTSSSVQSVVRTTNTTPPQPPHRL